MSEMTDQEDDDRFVLEAAEFEPRLPLLQAWVYGRGYRRNEQNTGWDRTPDRDTSDFAHALLVCSYARANGNQRLIEEALRTRAKQREQDQRLRDLESEVSTLRALIQPPEPGTGWVILDEDGYVLTRRSGFRPRDIANDYGVAFFDSKGAAEAVIELAQLEDTHAALVDRKSLEPA